MTTLTFPQVRKIQEDKLTSILSNNNVFWAFNQDQMNEGKAKNPIQEGDVYVHIGGGGYMPKSKVNSYLKDMEQMQTEFRQLVNENNLQEREILYHLSNHECFYTGDITDAENNLDGIYTREEILKVFYANYEEYSN